jgi:hypothetical protein
LQLLLLWLAWILLWSIYYGFKYNEGNITGDLAHQVTTALNRADPSLFARDYLYKDPATLAYYPPLQVWSIAGLYLLTDSISWSLAVLQFLYSAVCVAGAWLIARQISRNVATMALIMIALLAFTISPLNGGHTWGMLKGIFPSYFPYNALLARGLVLIFLSLVIAGERSSATLQAAILGLVFTVHAPTGLTLTLGAVPYFLWRLFRSTNRITDAAKWAAAFLVGAAVFLTNYLGSTAPASALSPSDQAFLYDFWQYRFPEDYPAPLWKLVLKGLPGWGWIAHAALACVSLVAVWGLVRKNPSVLITAGGLLLAYIFGLAALPLTLLVLYVAWQLRGSEGAVNFHAIWTASLIAFGAFFVCTWLQWASDIYHASVRRPPFLIDNMRFLPVLFAFVSVTFVAAASAFRERSWMAIGAYCLLSVPLAFPLLDRSYQEFADAHAIKWRAQYDFDPRFALSAQDEKRVIDFASTTRPNSVFLYFDSNSEGWYFRLRARRAIAINTLDLAVKYYSQKDELVRDWPVYLEILKAYREKDLRALCRATESMEVDYVVFPEPAADGDPCFAVALRLEKGVVLQKRTSR